MRAHEIRMGKRIATLLKQTFRYGYALDTGNQSGRLCRLLKGRSARVIVTIEKADPKYRARWLDEIRDLGRHAR
jgi:putative NADPH-quinone reductase